MKTKCFFIRVILVISVLLFSCCDHLTEESFTGGSTEIEVSLAPGVSKKIPSTRVIINESVSGTASFTWEDGDEIGVVAGGAIRKFTISSIEGNTARFIATLPPGVVIEDNADIAYPYVEDDYSNGSFSLSYPTSYVSNNPNSFRHRWAGKLKKTSENKFSASFELQTGIIRVTYQDVPSSASAISLTADKAIAGNSKTITVNFNWHTDDEMSFYFPVPADNYNSFNVKLLNGQDVIKGTERTISGGNMNVSTGCIYRLPTISRLRILVAYFSLTNTTKEYAERIRNLSGGSIYEITPTEAYSTDIINYSNTNNRAYQEQNGPASVRPSIVADLAAANKYDVVLLGFPIWYGKVPRIIFSFLDKYNFAGKIVIPFCTSASSGIDDAQNELESTYTSIRWQQGSRLNGFSDDQLREWLLSFGISTETVKPIEPVRITQIGSHDMDPHIGDFSSLTNTYFRMLIGVDSEGWSYVAQRKYANLSSGDANVRILRTKDFAVFEVFKANSCGYQVVELENGELCLATVEGEKVDGIWYLKCFIYITSNNKTVFNKKFECSQIGQYEPAYPWSWGISTRGSVIAISEYGKHGQCGKVWYSRDYGDNFYNVFDLRNVAPDVPHAHVHGVCVDPYFDRLYIINGDGSPATTPDLLGKNPRIWYWDYNGEVLSDNLINSISWNYISVGEDNSLGAGMQFVNGYALKDCILLFSDGANNGIFRINRGNKEDVPRVEYAIPLGIETGYTMYCGGNMFRRNEQSPLFICGIREFSNDLDPSDPNNPNHKPNTYKDVKSCVFATYDGVNFDRVWLDNTYGEYAVHYSNGTSEQRNLAKCGRDMSVYQLPNGHLLLKYIGRDFTYVSYNNNGSTAQKAAYVPFCNEVLEFSVE